MVKTAPSSLNLDSERCSERRHAFFLYSLFIWTLQIYDGEIRQIIVFTDTFLFSCTFWKFLVFIFIAASFCHVFFTSDRSLTTRDALIQMSLWLPSAWCHGTEWQHIITLPLPYSKACTKSSWLLLMKSDSTSECRCLLGCGGFCAVIVFRTEASGSEMQLLRTANFDPQMQFLGFHQQEVAFLSEDLHFDTDL